MIKTKFEENGKFITTEYELSKGQDAYTEIGEFLDMYELSSCPDVCGFGIEVYQREDKNICIQLFIDWTGGKRLARVSVLNKSEEGGKF